MLNCVQHEKSFITSGPGVGETADEISIGRRMALIMRKTNHGDFGQTGISDLWQIGKMHSLIFTDDC